MTVWKHHIAEHFVSGKLPAHPNGGGVGGTVFLSRDQMLSYLKKDGRDWWVAELEVEANEIKIHPECDYMADLLVNKLSTEGFKPIV